MLAALGEQLVILAQEIERAALVGELELDAADLAGVDPLSAWRVRFQLLDTNYSADHCSDRNNPDQPAGQVQIDGTDDQKSDEQGNERESNVADVRVHPIDSLSLAHSPRPPDAKQHIST